MRHHFITSDMQIAILGGGHGCYAAAADLSEAGHQVRLWRRDHAALAGLRATFEVVVADIDADLEGEAECGSIEVEERNTMARTVANRADGTTPISSRNFASFHGSFRIAARSLSVSGRTLSYSPGTGIGPFPQ